MAESELPSFQRERERLNRLVMEMAGTQMKRLFNLDAAVYRDGHLAAKTKEMMGLVASLVLRCDDCILYHLIECRKKGMTTEELEELLTIGWTIGGSITVPHIRRAVDSWVDLLQEKQVK